MSLRFSLAVLGLFLFLASCSHPSPSGALGAAADSGAVDTTTDGAPTPEAAKEGDVLHNAAPPERPPSTSTLEPFDPVDPSVRRALEELEERQRRAEETYQEYEEANRERGERAGEALERHTLGLDAGPIEPLEESSSPFSNGPIPTLQPTLQNDPLNLGRFPKDIKPLQPR